MKISITRINKLERENNSRNSNYKGAMTMGRKLQKKFCHLFCHPSDQWKKLRCWLLMKYGN